jgi:lysophospholipase L1-like esterase
MDVSAAAVNSENAPAEAGKRNCWKQLRWSTRICLVLTRILILVVLLEVASRAYWTVGKKVPAFHTGQISNSFFPQLVESNVDQAPCDQNDGVLDVLVLGPSVWYYKYGDVAPRFEKALAAKLGRPVRVFNCSYTGNTTRDALLVYHKVAAHRFDLVVVYHGINDVFLNNCPPDNFRPDYLHAPRFQQIAMLEAHPEHEWFVLPYTLRFLRSHIGDKLHIDVRPKKEYAAEYGGNLRTPAAVRSNLQEIIEFARGRNEQVLLVTNAWYLPSNYTEEAFAAQTLDYDRHICTVKAWGTPEHVAAALKAHNDVIRDLARNNPDLLFADMEAAMPPGKLYYDDLCHFNPKGCEVFVDLLVRNVDWPKLRPPALP